MLLALTGLATIQNMLGILMAMATPVCVKSFYYRPPFHECVERLPRYGEAN